jgi:hypothetical protein
MGQGLELESIHSACAWCHARPHSDRARRRATPLLVAVGPCHAPLCRRPCAPSRPYPSSPMGRGHSQVHFSSHPHSHPLSPLCARAKASPSLLCIVRRRLGPPSTRQAPCPLRAAPPKALATTESHGSAQDAATSLLCGHRTVAGRL